MHFSQTGFLPIKSAISHSAGWNGTFDSDAHATASTQRLPSPYLTARINVLSGVTWTARQDADFYLCFPCRL
jgi:hypothetical protein